MATHEQRFKVGDIAHVVHDEDTRMSWVGWNVFILDIMANGLPYDYLTAREGTGENDCACFDDWELEPIPPEVSLAPHD